MVVVRGIREADLVCPFCTAANSPGKTVIELARDGTAICGCCTRSWTPTKERT